MLRKTVKPHSYEYHLQLSPDALVKLLLLLPPRGMLAQTLVESSHTCKSYVHIITYYRGWTVAQAL